MIDLTYPELLKIAEIGLHTHVNNQSDNDICKVCGEHLMHQIHFGMDRFKKETEHLKCMMKYYPPLTA